jgi:hypothetical protein
MRRLAAVIALALVAGGGRHWTREPDEPAETDVSVLAEFPAGTDVLFSGEVSLFGELFCPCFVVTEDDASAVVWYDLTEQQPLPAEDLMGVENGAPVRVRGVLQGDRDPGSGYPVVWATEIRAGDGGG